MQTAQGPRKLRRNSVCELVFFFQAEDGIRDIGVTGVQTCALPILDRRLATREFLAGAYSIADMAAYPWVVPHEAQGQNLSDFPHVKRWFETIKARPAKIGRASCRERV